MDDYINDPTGGSLTQQIIQQGIANRTGKPSAATTAWGSFDPTKPQGGLSPDLLKYLSTTGALTDPTGKGYQINPIREGAGGAISGYNMYDLSGGASTPSYRFDPTGAYTGTQSHSADWLNPLTGVLGVAGFGLGANLLAGELAGGAGAGAGATGVSGTGLSVAPGTGLNLASTAGGGLGLSPTAGGLGLSPALADVGFTSGLSPGLAEAAGVAGAAGGAGGGAGSSYLPITGESSITSLPPDLAGSLGVIPSPAVTPAVMPPAAGGGGFDFSLAGGAPTAAGGTGFSPVTASTAFNAGMAPGFSDLTAAAGGETAASTPEALTQAVAQGGALPPAGGGIGSAVEAAAKKMGGSALDYLLKNPMQAAMLGMSLKNATTQPQLPSVARTALGAGTAATTGGLAAVQSGGTNTPVWATQKASIDQAINQNLKNFIEQIKQEAANSGMGADSMVVQQRIKAATDQAEAQRQQQYAAAQQQNISNAVAEMSGGNATLASIANMQLGLSQQARTSAAETAALATQLGR